MVKNCYMVTKDNQSDTIESIFEKMLNKANATQKTVYGIYDNILYVCYSWFDKVEQIEVLLNGGGYCV